FILSLLCLCCRVFFILVVLYQKVHLIRIGHELIACRRALVEIYVHIDHAVLCAVYLQPVVVRVVFHPQSGGFGGGAHGGFFVPQRADHASLIREAGGGVGDGIIGVAIIGNFKAERIGKKAVGRFDGVGGIIVSPYRQGGAHIVAKDKG